LTKETQNVGLSRALRQLQLAEKELRRLGGDEVDIVRLRIEASELVKRIAAALAQRV